MHKKVTFIINGGPIKNIGTSGGEERYLLLAQYLYIKKYDICVCCPKEYLNAKRIKANRFLTYTSLPFEEQMYKNPVLLFFIYCYRILISTFKIRKIKTGIIISSSHLFHDVIPLFFLGNRDFTFVTYIHHIISEQQRRGISAFVTKFLEKVSFYVLRKVNSIVFTDSETNKASLINKYGFEENYAHVIKNGINLNFINSVEVIKEPIYDICFCGRLDKKKGIYDLVNIIKEVKEQYPRISCVIIGQGNERDNLEKTIKNSNLENNIKLTGYISEKEKIETMKLSKIFVLPSHEEGWGIVIGEAMACGIPVVVYKLKDIVGIWGDAVTWVECFDLSKFSDEIIKLLKNDKARNIFAQKGLKFTKTIGWNDVLKNELSVIINT